MNRGLILKTCREIRGITILCAVFLCGLQMVLAFVFPAIFEDFGGQFMRTRFGKLIFSSLLGVEVGETLGPGAMQAIAWVHPLALATISAHVITCCTRLPAGEVDRGTIDLLFGLPVSRAQVIVHEAIVWAGAGMLVIAMGLLGSWLGGMMVSPEFQPDMSRLFASTTNLYALYLAIGGFACLCSALSDRRGRAVAGVVSLILVAFLLNFIAPLWEPAEAISFLSLLHYYRPLPIIRGEGIPAGDVAVLLGVAIACFAAGAAVFGRRDLCTV